MIMSCLGALQVYMDLPGFSCPGVPVVPAFCIFVNIFLFAQVWTFLHFSNTIFLFEGVTKCWLSMHHYMILLFVSLHSVAL